MSKLDDVAAPAGICGVYVAPREHVVVNGSPATIDGRPVTAVAPHPRDEQMVFVTTENPEMLGFLPDGYWVIDPG